MIETKKDLILLLKQLDQCGNEVLVKDVLRIILTNRRHQIEVLNKIKNIGTKKENNGKIKNIIEGLKNISNVHIRNNGAVIYYKTLSIACRHCIKDLGCTLRMTTQCNRNCFFCFTDNLPRITKNEPDILLLKNIIRKRLKEIKFKSFAISGGEPFLYPETVFKMLRYVNKKFNNKIYTRVYTNGDLVNENILKKLRKLRLNEIRYSIKPLEEPNIVLLKTTKKYIPKVLIEVPVLPHSDKFMKNLIYKIDRIKIDGINLLELFFNGYHINNFKEKKYKIDLDSKQIREIYNTKPIYEYPVYGSKLLCLNLIKHFATAKVNLFINFCSQATKQLQYDQKIRRVAIKRKSVYSGITNKNTHEILAIYSNIKIAKDKLLLQGKQDFYLRKDHNKIQRLETNIKYLKYFIQHDYLLVKIYRDPSNTYDIDFELIHTKQSKIKNRDIHKLIIDFKNYVNQKRIK